MITLDMQYIRYLNLLEQISRVRAKHCFAYNNAILFAVPREFVAKTIGLEARNIRKVFEITGKRAKVVALPDNISDAEKFISEVISPVGFNEISINENEILITAGSYNKAALIGRNRVRLEELQKIVKEYFDKELRII